MESKQKKESFNDWVRGFYDDKAKNYTRGDYEKFRWFASKKKKRQYYQTTRSLLFHLRNVNFKTCLDIGCGPGTWTFLLLKKYPSSKFTCLDISKEMLTQFKSRVNEKRINFVVSAFTDFKKKEKYDFIFASRSIDYMENKSLVIKKMYDLLNSGGKGIIVTSPPHPTFIKIKKFLGKKLNKQHTQRISVKKMNKLLQEVGFKNIEFSPILFTDSLPEFLNKFLFNLFYKKRWNLISKMFASGYLVKFEKN